MCFPPAPAAPRFLQELGGGTGQSVSGYVLESHIPDSTKSDPAQLPHPITAGPWSPRSPAPTLSSSLLEVNPVLSYTPLWPEVTLTLPLTLFSATPHHLPAFHITPNIYTRRVILIIKVSHNFHPVHPKQIMQGIRGIQKQTSVFLMLPALVRLWIQPHPDMRI